MMNTRKFGGGYSLPHYSEKGGTALISVPSERLPKGGQRCTNTSMIGGVMNG